MSEQTAKALQKDWQTERALEAASSAPIPRRTSCRLRGSVQIEHTLARLGAEKLWKLVTTEPYVNCLGALTGGQAMQQVKAGLKAIYLSGWQVAADNNSYMAMYPDQSLYPVELRAGGRRAHQRDLQARGRDPVRARYPRRAARNTSTTSRRSSRMRRRASAAC